ncbi:cation-transporting P-type ATPase [archaeon]|jgi:P-type Ca2+ transporter type 2C|nr:cation-transporting P-type ATPase [archaeon]
MKEAHTISLPKLYSKLNSSETGLTSKEAQLRLQKYGKNKIKKKKKLEPIKIFFSQFNSFLIYILIIAAIISFIINHIIDGSVILAIVILNSIIGFTQQYRAEKAIQNLKKLIVQKTIILRDGKQAEILSENLVPGDIIILRAGDKINADARIIESENAETNEAILTGESLPVTKTKGILKQQTALSERENLLFAGTSLVRGTAKALIVETGKTTVFGEIAESLQEIKQSKTPMQKRLDKFSKQIGIFILILVALIALLGLTNKFDLVEMFLTSVALAVSAIPEGLPAVLTLSFAISSILMSKRNVVIRRLPAVESLGSVTLICSDKTGTLTEEEMTVQEMYANSQSYSTKNIPLNKNKELELLLKTSILCNNARYELTNGKYGFIGDPTETALVKNALNFKLDKKILTENNSKIKKFEFDSIRKMMSVARMSDNKPVLYSKGAIEKILAKSNYELINGNKVKLTPRREREILEKVSLMEKKALRVLAFAYKEIDNSKSIKEDDLTFLGFLGMIDPPRPEVKQAITECKKAGIKIKMITGDSELTARAIGEKIGIVGKVINELTLEKMSDEDLKKVIEEIAIFARITPKQKLRLTKTFQDLGETVAITGDGINDALALKSADVGIAMGKRGTDVAREVSDIVLVDDNFASLVEGVKQGRRTYDNVKKFTKYFLSVNFDEILLVLAALLLGIFLPKGDWFLPLLPLQILWMNLITDSFPALALVLEKGENVMETKPRKEKSILDDIWKFVLIAGFVGFLAVFGIYMLAKSQGLPAPEVRTIALTTAIIYELLFVYVCRSKQPLKKIGAFSNKWLNYAVLFSFALHLVLLYTPLRNLFGVVPLTLNSWLMIIPFAISGIVIFEVAKLVMKK